MSDSIKTTSKTIAILLLAVVFAGGLGWLRTYHGHEEWARIVWRLIWFFLVPVLILISIWILKRGRNASEKRGDPNK